LDLFQGLCEKRESQHWVRTDQLRSSAFSIERGLLLLYCFVFFFVF
jgi:hypothetical protein